MSNVLTRQIADMLVEGSKDGNVYVAGEYTEIEARAFSQCKNLRSIDLQKTKIKRINELAFRNCESLESVLFPPTLEYIGFETFRNCNSIREIELPNMVNKIDGNAFESCGFLQKIVLNSKVKEIGTEAFRECVSLKEIVLPESRIQVGAGAFFGCEQLESIIIKGVISNIPAYFCYGCKKLTGFQFDKVCTISNKTAFYNCDLLEIPTDKLLAKI